MSSYSCLSYSPPLVLVLAQDDGVGGQQGLTHQAVLQASETLKSFQDLQLRPDHSGLKTPIFPKPDVSTARATGSAAQSGPGSIIRDSRQDCSEEW